jgi:hypothetical protein
MNGAVPSSTDLIPTVSQLNSGSSANIFTLAGEIMTFNTAGRFFVYYVATATTTISMVALPIPAGCVIVGGWIPNVAQNLVAFTGSATTECSCALLVDAIVGGSITFNFTDVLGIVAQMVAIQVPSTFSFAP